MEIAKLKVLVTGGAGFIGSHIVEDLVRHGAAVRVYDNLSSGCEANLDPVRRDVEIVRGDILDVRELRRAATGMDVVCHQAAQLEIIRCIEAPVEDLRSNTQGTLNVLEAAKLCGIRKVVFASSACVYGQAQYTPQDEAHRTLPNWPYGISKLASEHYARLYHDSYGIETIGLRYSIVYGPREWYGRVLTAFLKRALEKKPPVVWGGHQQRDFVYVTDVARVNRLCIEHDGLAHQILNVSTAVPTSVVELATLVCGLFGLDEPIFEDVPEGEPSPLMEGRIRLPAELQMMVLDNRRAMELLDWVPAVALRDGIRTEMQWLMDNADRWVVMHY